MAVTKNLLSIVVGISSALFIGYCFYFDKKRRSDPDFKKKLRARREEQRRRESAKNASPRPNLYDQEAIQRYFVQEIQMGETLIARGNFESGVEHLANALVVCSQAGRLLQVLQNTLPAPVFAMLIMRVQEMSNGEKSNEQTTANDNAKTSVNNTLGPHDSAAKSSATASHAREATVNDIE